MQVSEFMRRGIVKAEVTDSLAQAAERMRALEVSALPVFNGVRMVGIITERDMAHAIAERLNPDLVTVFMRMTPEPLAASPADTATETVLMDARAPYPPPAGFGLRRAGRNGVSPRPARGRARSLGDSRLTPRHGMACQTGSWMPDSAGGGKTFILCSAGRCSHLVDPP